MNVQDNVSDLTQMSNIWKSMLTGKIAKNNSVWNFEIYKHIHFIYLSLLFFGKNDFLTKNPLNLANRLPIKKFPWKFKKNRYIMQ